MIFYISILDKLKRTQNNYPPIFIINCEAEKKTTLKDFEINKKN